ncbi:MAG: S9 family peptidase [Chloroflexota bacterium]
MSDAKRPLTAADLYDLKLVSDPQISPDGKHTIFSVIRVDKTSEKKHSDLWLANLENGQKQQFTFGDYTDTSPRWSPDGQAIAFLSNRKNEQQMQIYILPFTGGEARPLTDLKGSFAEYSWSPDGTKLLAQFRKIDEDALERQEDEKKKKLGVVARHITSLGYKFDGAGYLPKEMWHIWIIDVATGESKQLTDGESHESDLTWSPDGTQILFTSNRHPNWILNPKEDSFYRIPAEGGDMVRLASNNGRKGSPAYSPDGTKIAFLGTEDVGHFSQNSNLYVMSADGGDAQNLTKAYDLTISPSTLGDTGSGTPFPRPVWSLDGQKIYVIASDKGDQPIVAVNNDGSGIERLVGDGGIIDGFTMSNDQTQIAFQWGTIEAPANLATMSLADKNVEIFTNYNDALLEEIAFGQFEEVWIDTPAQTKLQGWILTPPDFDPSKTYPSILEIHGGPFAQYGRSFMHEFHYFAANGYVVYCTNPRGSQGYGQAHATAISNQWGTVDYDDVMTWTDYVAQRPFIDKDRMGVTGGSYGGYMTTLIIGKTDRFKAAVAQRLVSNLISFYGSSDMTWNVEGLTGIPTQPWHDLESYWRQSPISLIGNAKTPTMVVHSERDYRCDREQGEQVFAALQRMEVPSEMILFPEESHGLSRNGRTDRRIQRLEHMLRWFDNYLK